MAWNADLRKGAIFKFFLWFLYTFMKELISMKN